MYYVYYDDNGTRYPAFCVEPAKLGVGTGYDSYTATIKKVQDMYSNGTEKLNQMWRILNKTYMNANWTDWKNKGIECEDDLYSATKIALHSLAQGIAPKDKYILGDSPIDGNTVEEIQRRGQTVLNVASELYYEALNGTDTYQKPQISIEETEESKIEIIDNVEYYVQSYSITANKYLKSYDILIQEFPNGTRILNSNNQDILNSTSNIIKIAIPISQIKQDINGQVIIQNAYVKTNPIYYCQSSKTDAQSYVTYTNPYETTNTKIDLNIKANKSKLIINKLDAETNEPLSNVKFEILDSEKNKITEVVTDDNGEAVLENIYPQTVFIRELEAKDGYNKSDIEKEVILKYGDTATITFDNEKKKGQIRILKVDKNDHDFKLEDVEFEIRDEEGNILEKISTDKDGIALSKEYAVIDYPKLIIKEIKTWEDYELFDKEIVVNLKENEIEDITIENSKIVKLEPEPELPKLPRTGF